LFFDEKSDFFFPGEDPLKVTLLARPVAIFSLFFFPFSLSFSLFTRRNPPVALVRSVPIDCAIGIDQRPLDPSAVRGEEKLGARAFYKERRVTRGWKIDTRRG